ncbi:unnamed protein product [Ranitomeya imitator]|uniref:G-protein coupled receptors family 1 profile domain-containing protein n=1 Tax=Ranitomeya imitator TaxID=111125 RepID=A0ABN9MJU6_9NEOB|nr:unnamed protein product [Ranitomeya imitator]
MVVLRRSGVHPISKSQDRETMLNKASSNRVSSEEHITFTTTYSPQFKEITDIIRKRIPMLSQDKKLNQILSKPVRYIAKKSPQSEQHLIPQPLCYMIPCIQVPIRVSFQEVRFYIPSVDEHLRQYSGEIQDQTFIITFLMTCFVLPLILIFVSYGKLMRKLRKVSDTQSRLGSSRKPEKEVTRMVIIMILAFLICWSPYAAFSILVTAHPTIELDPRLSAIPAFFAKTASMYNPLSTCLLQMFHCNDLDLKESNNPTTERVMLNRTNHGSEMHTIAAHISTNNGNRKTEEEQSSCNSFAQLPMSENKICPM